MYSEYSSKFPENCVKLEKTIEKCFTELTLVMKTTEQIHKERKKVSLRATKTD